MAKIIDFTKAKLEMERKLYELNLDTPITTTRREIEEMAIDIVMNFAELHDIEAMLVARLEREANEQNTQK